MSKIEVSHIYKIFGPHPERWLKAAQEGMSKEDLLARSGHTLGLRDISLSIEEGSIYVIMGLSGSGKSTLIRHFNRLIEPTAGEIRVDGQNVVELGRRDLAHFRQQKMSMVFQRFGLFPHRTVLDNAAYGLAVQKVPRAQREEKARYWLDQVGLSGFENQYPNQLSGGMQSRAALARALVLEPDLLLLDEPFAALDIGLKAQMHQLLLEQQRTRGLAVLMITHDVTEAITLADRVRVMAASPGCFVWEMTLPVPAIARSEAWVHQHTAALLAQPVVRAAFELPPLRGVAVEAGSGSASGEGHSAQPRHARPRQMNHQQLYGNSNRSSDPLLHDTCHNAAHPSPLFR